MPATGHSRRNNERRALATLFRDGPCTRAGLARRLATTRSTAGLIVDGLLEAELAREDRTAHEDAADPLPRIGRPGTLIGLHGPGAHFIGAEIGVDRLAVVTLDLEARPVHRERVRHDGPASAPEETVGKLAAMLRAAVANAPGTVAPHGTSITVPGYIDDVGACHAAMLGWDGVPIGALLDAAIDEVLGTDFPRLLENDANACAVAEVYGVADADGADGADAHRDTVVVLVEDGVGAGILHGGRLHRGRRHGAGEIGHMPLGSACRDDGDAAGNVRLEALVGRAAALGAWHVRGGRGDTEALVRACTAGDAVALDIARAWAVTLARGLACVACTLEPQAFVIGGSVGRLAGFARDTLGTELARHLPAGYPLPTVRASRLDDDGCAIGAACLLHERFLDAAPPAFSLTDAPP